MELFVTSDAHVIQYESQSLPLQVFGYACVCFVCGWAQNYQANK